MTKVYDDNDKSIYSKHVVTESQQAKQRVEQEAAQFVLGGILKVKKLKINAKKVDVPAGYNPFKNVARQEIVTKKKQTLAEQILEEQKEKFEKKFGGKNPRSNLDANQRAQIIGETSQQSQKSQPSSSNFAPAAQPNQVSLKYLTFHIDIPFRYSDPGKFLRFQAYILEKEGQLVYFDVPNNMMTGSQMRVENQEFEKLHKLHKLAGEQGYTTQGDTYQKGVFTSEMKNSGDIQKKIDALEKSLNRREERDWQPAHLLLLRCALRDPHEQRKVKPPMYFKSKEQKKGYTEFDSRETLNQMPMSVMANAFEDGNTYFKDIQEQYASNESVYVEVVGEKEGGTVEVEEGIVDEIPEKVVSEQVEIIEVTQQRPPMSLFESIFNNDDGEEEV
ncbi:hypothetical protein FGO68_gene12465 [Halteria grandinella]|uniref:Uncharacterized protein n=1 Tax=Halteria grandinella TaxID=5974 RepID=A0A8J8NX67_HALGN|nr:hypothetical protein FGO68_gene12465 [Halteria grandinella]